MATQSKKAGSAGAKKTRKRTEEKPAKKRTAPAKRSKSTAKPSKAVKKSAAPKKAAKKAAARSPAKKAAAKPKKTAAKRIAKAVKKPTAKKAAVKNAVAKKSLSKPSPAKKAARGKTQKVNVDQVIKEFRSVVNLKPNQLERWLSMPDSKKLGFKDEVKAGTRGHESGRRILKILTKRRDKYTDDDLRHMQTVVGFVRQHRREKPPGDVFASNWRYSLMNWGHDPMK